MIEVNHPNLSVKAQCQLLQLARSGYYYSPQPVSLEEEKLMNLLDKHYTDHPCEGKIKRAQYLTDAMGYTVGVRRVRALMEKMGLETLYPKPNTSVPNKAHEVYPYLLKDRDILYPNEVWAADITYIPLRNHHVYLFAIIDWFSRYVVEWSIAPTLEAKYCVETLSRALSNGHCEIFNTDQGSQFTSQDWLDVLIEAGISISMDGRGCFYDNIFVERLWRTIKQECIYRREFKTIHDVDAALHAYIPYYNNERKHQGLCYRTPREIYLGAA